MPGEEMKMTSRTAKYLTATMFCGLTGLASAEIPAIDIFKATGVPGTGGYSTIMGPCYCDQQAFFSPIMLLQPGTYDFGEIRDYWVQSGSTPDGGADQPNLYLLFSPVNTSGSYPDDFPDQTSYAYPSYALCDQNDAACNASYRGSYADFDLIFTVSPGQNAVQVGLIGNYQYTSPLPEPFTFAMLVLGLTLIAGISKKRGHADRARPGIAPGGLEGGAGSRSS
jgi:hypothetical protein